MGCIECFMVVFVEDVIVNFFGDCIEDMKVGDKVS